MASVPVQLFSSLPATVGSAGSPVKTASLATSVGAAPSHVDLQIGCSGLSDSTLTLEVGTEIDNGDGQGFIAGPKMSGVRPPVHNKDGSLATVLHVVGSLDPNQVGNAARQLRAYVSVESNGATVLVTLGAGTVTLT